jgi:hypothetical protein
VVQGTPGASSRAARLSLRRRRRDGIETLQCTTRQPWFDGHRHVRVRRHTQWALADQSGPGPTALMIQIASTSFRECFIRRRISH